MVPAISSVHAAGNIPPTITVTNNRYYGGGSTAEVDLNISNPSSNQFGIKEVNVTAPNLWTFASSTCTEYALPGDVGNFYFSGCSEGATGLTTQWSTTSSFTLPPGQTQDVAVNVIFPNFGLNGAVCGTFTSEVFDSAGGHYAGPTFQLCSFNPATSFHIHDGGVTSFIAGSSPITVWANIGVAESGIGVFFQSVDPEVSCSSGPYIFDTSCTSADTGTFSGSGVVHIDSFLVEAWTNSSGIAAVTYTPLNIAPSTTRLTAYLGGGPTCEGFWTNNESPLEADFGCDSYWAESTTITLSTVATTPTVLAFLLGGAGSDAFPATHYVTAHHAPINGGTGNFDAWIASTEIYLQVADSFGNNVSLATLTGKTVSVSTSSAQGVFNLGPGTNKTTITFADGGVISAAPGGEIVTDYLQSGTWGSIGVLSALVSGTYPVTAATIALSANSGNIVTSTFDSSANAVACHPSCSALLPAVSTDTVKYTTSVAQLNVPVTFYATNTTAYNGLYSMPVANMGHSAFNGQAVVYGFWVGGTMPWDPLTGMYNISTTTLNSGLASDVWTIDSTFGSTAVFSAVIARPTDAHPNGVLITGPSIALTTTFGQAVNIFVASYFDNTLHEPTLNAFTAATLFVDVYSVDLYGNVAVDTLGAQIQITLHPSAGLVSAANPFIAANNFDTNTFPSFGPVTWTTGGTAPTTITLTATANVPGQTMGSTSVDTLNIVTKTPSFTAAASSGNTYSGIVYSKTLAVSFTGTAAVSLGYDPALGVNFATHAGGIYYKIDNGAWVLGTTSHLSSVTWNVINVVFTSGLHTITFYANDSKADQSASVTLQVLVDNSAPTVAFGAGQTTVPAGTPVMATIVDTEGDLNATSVVATSNSTATLTAAVTGTNNPGNSVTYTVAITGLPASTGHWKLTLSGKDYAGNAASASLVLKVTVAFAVSFVISGTPTVGTLGGYTGINAAYQNLNPTSQSVVVFAVWKLNGQTQGTSTSSATVAAGATYSAFLVEPVGLSSGSYTVNLFVWTTGNAPVSSTTTISVSV